MKKSFVLACLVSGIALAATACDEGRYNELECDESYNAECLDRTHMMVCDAGTLIVTECDPGLYCHVESSLDADGNAVLGKASCSPTGESIPLCDCTTGLNCTEAQKAKCVELSACDCVTGLNCTDAEKAACSQPTLCDCATGANCTDAEKADCDKCQLGTLKCETDENGAVASVCDSSGKWVSSNCQYGCNGNVCASDKCEYSCKDGVSLSVSCLSGNSYDVTCAASCDATAQKCVDMVIENIGGVCNPDEYKDQCVGSMLGFCREGSIVAAYCSGGSSCQISSKLNGYGDCVATCEEAGDVKNECIYDEDYECYVPSKTVCESINGVNYEFSDVIDYCYTGCNDDNTGCKLEKENEFCSGSEPQACSDDGSYSIYCYQDKDYGSFWTGDVCGETETCMVDDAGNAGCYEPCTEAEVGNVIHVCQDYNYIFFMVPVSEARVCTKIGENKYAYVVDEAQSVMCEHECSATDNLCVLLDDSEGGVCDETYNASCKNDNSIALNCYDPGDDGYIYGEDCSALGENYFCTVDTDNNIAGCVERCTEKDATSKRCVEGDYAYEVVETKCIEDPELGLVWGMGETLYECADVCSDDASDCERNMDEEYTPCDDTYTEKCVNGFALYCGYDSVVNALDCESDSQICVVNDANYADCYDLCIKEGEVLKECDEYYEEAVTYVCTRLENGMLVNMIQNYEECANGCNATNTACK